MQDIHSLIRNLKRPRLLVQAARFGVDAYRREHELPRTLKTYSIPRPAEAIMQLMNLEAEFNDMRLAGASDYSVAHHVDALTAIMAEARLLQAVTRVEDVK